MSTVATLHGVADPHSRHGRLMTVGLSAAVLVVVFLLAAGLLFLVAIGAGPTTYGTVGSPT